MNNLKAAYAGKDQNHQDETTNYWFELDGDKFAISECSGELSLLDCDGSPLNLDDSKNKEIFDKLVVTDEMRSD